MTTPGGPPARSAGGPRYRLRPSVEAFVDRHGTLCFVRPGGQDLVVRHPDPIDVRLVERLAAASETADALAVAIDADPADVRRKLDSLVAADLALVRPGGPAPPLESGDSERFSRQLPYLAELGDELVLQRRLRDTTIAVVGCGGIGTWAIAALGCIGIGKFVLVDDDEVALSNLNRQILYTTSDIGAPKVAASARWVRAFDPDVEVVTVERRITGEADLTPHLSGVDAVVLAADWPPYSISRWVNTVCVRRRIPFIVAGQLPPVVKVGPTYVPGEAACFTCHETALRRESAAYDDYVTFRLSNPTMASTVGPASCLIGGLIGLELMHLLTGHRPVTQDCALVVHMKTLEVRREPIRRDPTCETCKHLE